MSQAAPTSEIHGHDLIDLIRSSPSGYTQTELIAAAAEKFGTDAKFHTCSAQGMSLGQLVQFLFAREKIAFSNGRLKVVEANVCNHQ